MVWLEKLIMLLPVVSAIGLMLLVIAILPGRPNQQTKAGIDRAKR